MTRLTSDALRQVLTETPIRADCGFSEAGDVIVVLEPSLPGLPAEVIEPKLKDLIAMLTVRNFVRSATTLAHEALADVLARNCRASGLGCEVDLEIDSGASAESAFMAPRPGAAIVTCRSNAHLALAKVAERGGTFTAQAAGKVRTKGFTLRANGRVFLSIDDLP